MALTHEILRDLTSVNEINLSSNALTYVEASVLPA